MLRLLLFSILFTACPVLCSQVEPLIIGGRPALPGEFPYQLSIRINGKHECGATLVRSPLGNQMGITAAHCVIDVKTTGDPLLPLNTLTVVAGSIFVHATNQQAQIVKVRGIVKHENYQRNINHRNDIAIIFFSKPFVLNDNVQPISLPFHGGKYPSGSLIVSGWGRVNSPPELPEETPNTLQVVEVPVVSLRKCVQQYAIKYGRKVIFSSNICAGLDSGGLDSCQGDSGGPAVQTSQNGKVYLEGITSWGYGCGLPGFPGVYSKVGYYLPWIVKRAIIFEIFGLFPAK